MEHGDNVVAFGGFTPAFLLADPYVAKSGTSRSDADDSDASAPEELEKTA